MRMYWRALFATMLAAGTFSHAQANGSIFDTPHRVSGNVLSSSKRFALEREQLNIQLNAVDYEAKVTYFLTDTTEKKKEAPAASMYFPVICGSIDDYQTPPKYIGGCIEKFRVWINNQSVPSKPISSKEIAKNKVLYRLANKINKRAQKQYEAVENDISSKYVFFKIDIPADIDVNTFTVQYKTRYAQVTGGSNKSAHEYFENAHMIYDFFPAAAWMGEGDKELNIKLDISHLQSTLTYDKKRWPFVKNNDVLTLTLRNPNFAALPPLILTTNNGPYQTFVSDMRRLKDSTTKYHIKVLNATESHSKHHDVNALFDRNPNTFWCWKGDSATLEMELDPFVIHSHYDRVDKEWTSYSARFESLVVLNGAVVNKQTFEKFGLARIVEIHALETLTDPEKETVELPSQLMKSGKDKFQSLTTLTREGGSVSNLFSDQNPGSFGDVTEKDRAQIAKQKILFKITNVYKKKHTDESCISEIYPIYNPG